MVVCDKIEVCFKIALFTQLNKHQTHELSTWTHMLPEHRYQVEDQVKEKRKKDQAPSVYIPRTQGL